MADTASELYNDLLRIYFDQYNDLPNAERSKLEPKYDPVNLAFDRYDYDKWFKEELENLSPNQPIEDDEEKIDDLPPLKGDEGKLKEGKGLKILTTNKLLTRLPILHAFFYKKHFYKQCQTEIGKKLSKC